MKNFPEEQFPTPRKKLNWGILISIVVFIIVSPGTWDIAVVPLGVVLLVILPYIPCMFIALLSSVKEFEGSAPVISSIIFPLATASGLVFIFAFFYENIGTNGLTRFKPTIESIITSINSFTTLQASSVPSGPQAQIVAGIETFIGYIYLGVLAGFYMQLLRLTLEKRTTKG